MQTKTQHDFRSRLGWLEYKFNSSGVGENLTISNEELMELQTELQKISDFLHDTNNMDMSHAMTNRAERVKSVIRARKE